MVLNKINNGNDGQAYMLLENCCCASKWIKKMLHHRPYADVKALVNASKETFSLLTEQDYLEAFQGHPQIGDLDSLIAKYAASSESASDEQSGMCHANTAVMEEMHALNQQYLRKFGFIFIVCASGKSAPQMLQLIKDRIGHERLQELKIAAAEQVKITTLRLEKLI